MKTKFNQIIRVLLVILLISGAIPVLAQGNRDFYIIKGVVKDKITKKCIEYANISILGTNGGTVTNVNGEFTIKVRNSFNAKALEISHIGYSSFKMDVNGKNSSDNVIFLTPIPILLDEITIRAIDPKLLAERAIKKIETNYNSEPSLLTGFYRETIKKRRSYINVSEAIVEIYKTPYTHGVDADLVQIYKGRKLISPKPDDTLMVKLLGGPNLSIFIDVVKNQDLMLNMNNIQYYRFKMEQSVMIYDRPHYVVSFEPQVVLPYALHYGKLFIDAESYAFSRVEFSLSMDDKNKATDAILKRKPFSLRFKPELITFLVTYTQREGKSYLNYVRSEVNFKCDWKRKLFSTNYSIISETVITGGKVENVTRIPNKLAFSENRSLSDNVINFFDKDFWEDYNIIEPDESLESAVNRLKKQQ